MADRIPSKTPRESISELAKVLYPEAIGQFEKVTIIPEAKRIARSVAFAVRFFTISPLALILFNVFLVNVLGSQSIGDWVLITYTGASSLSAFIQPLVGKIFEKIGEKVA